METKSHEQYSENDSKYYQKKNYSNCKGVNIFEFLNKMT